MSGNGAPRAFRQSGDEDDNVPLSPSRITPNKVDPLETIVWTSQKAHTDSDRSCDEESQIWVQQSFVLSSTK